MVVYTGILNFAKSEDELASVIGHEVAHAMARHGAERYSQITAANLTLAAVDVAVASSKKYSKYGEAIHVAFGLGAQLGVLLPYSRLHENEADYIGLLIMAKAGYDPQAAIQFWETMERESRRTQIEFISTHPSYDTRITNLKKWLPQALQYRENPLMPLPEKTDANQTPTKLKSPPVRQTETPEDLCSKGVILSQGKKYEEALSYFKKALEKSSGYAKAHFYVGYCNSELGRHQEAIEAYKQVINIEPNNASAQMNLGIAYSKLGRHEEATGAFKHAIRLNPDDFRAHGNLGLAYNKLGRHNEAIEAFKQVIRINPNNVTAHGNLGVTYSKLGRHEEAIEAYKQIIRINPNETRAHGSLGMAYARLGRNHEAVEAFNQVIRINPNDARAYNNRGYISLELGENQNAINDFKKAIELDKFKADPYVGLSIIHFRHRNIEEAKNYYKKALELEALFKEGPDLLERTKGYFFTSGQKQTINEILKLF